MSEVSITDLKARLSRYIREARRGGEVQILDRGVPVARLTSVESVAGSDEERRARLIESGVVRAGSGDASQVLARRPLNLPAGLLEALKEDRRDRF